MDKSALTTSDKTTVGSDLVLEPRKRIKSTTPSASSRIKSWMIDAERDEEATAAEDVSKDTIA